MARCSFKGWLDISQYLENEIALHPQHPPMMRPFIGRPRIFVFSLVEPLSVSWKWYTDPDGPAHDVLTEFENFGSARLYLFYNIEIERNLGNWPYMYRSWHCLAKEKEEYGLSELPERETYKIELVEERLRRRLQKRQDKLARAQGVYKTPRIPGAWID